jgi:hypothetical protein
MPIITGIPGFKFSISKVFISFVDPTGVGFVVVGLRVVVEFVANLVLRLLKSALAKKKAPAPIKNNVKMINRT